MGVSLIKWTERFAQRSKDPQLNTNLGPGQRSTTMARSQVCRGNVGATEGRDGPEGGRRASPRPAGLQPRVEATQQTPTPGTDQEHPGEGGGQMAITLLAYSLSRHHLRKEDKHTDLTCLQRTPTALPARNRPRKPINREPIHHL